jgi:hypothetical protein
MAGPRIQLALAVAALVLAPASAHAGGDGIRTSGTCGGGASSSLRLEPDDGEIELRFEARYGRGSPRWRVVVVQERRVVWRGRPRAHHGRVRVRRALTDLPGVDDIRVTATGPDGLSCVAAATLAGSRGRSRGGTYVALPAGPHRDDSGSVPS